MAVSNMSSVRIPMLIAVGLVVGCASSYRVVEVPQREADLYPLSQTRGGLSVAIDEITSSDRAARYFGVNLIEVGVVPLVVIISNNGTHRIDLKPSDVLLRQGTQIIDPLPVETVVTIAKNRHRPLRSSTQKLVAGYFDGVAFKEMVLAPGETYQGVLFFPIAQSQKKNPDSLFSAMSLFHESGLQAVVGARDLETGSRMHFGPFSLSIPQDSAH
jgi:hypothetical protein